MLKKNTKINLCKNIQTSFFFFVLNSLKKLATVIAFSFERVPRDVANALSSLTKYGKEGGVFKNLHL